MVRLAKAKRESTPYQEKERVFPENTPLFSIGDVFHTRHGVLALSEADRHRLVEGSKCPTRDLINKVKKKAYSIKSALVRKNTVNTLLPAVADGAYADIEGRDLKEAKTVDATTATLNDVKAAGTAVVCERRDWCDTYRIRTVTTPEMALSPPEQSGTRESDMLSNKAALKIAESCQYLAEKFDGYKTFVTWTFDDETRKRLDKRVAARLTNTGPFGPEQGFMGPLEPVGYETTLQKEITRSMDGLVKMYKRGWLMKDSYVPAYSVLGGHRFRGIKADGPCTVLNRNPSIELMKLWHLDNFVDPAGDDLRYCWVAEAPKNEDGEDNPHIHMLMDWRVPHKQFEAWAERIEGIWGNGFAHLEKIKDKGAAGAYMAKAAGYMSKASGQSDQGTIRGNRYAISTAARAPDWVTVSLHEFGIMGRLIRETYDSIQHRHKADFEERREQTRRRDEMNQRIKACTDEEEKQRLKSKRKTIAGKLMAVREKINARPIRASKYHVEIKSKTVFEKFLDRCRAVGWGADKPACTKWIYERKIFREAWFTKGLMRYTDNLIDKRASFYESANDGWQEYQLMAVG